MDALAEREIIDALSGRCSSGRSHSVDAGYSGSRRGGAGELYQEDRLSEGTFGNAVAQIPVCSLHSQLNNDGSSLPVSKPCANSFSSSAQQHPQH